MMVSKPDPGTSEAIQRGCSCPPTSRQPAKLKRYASVREANEDWMAVNPECKMHGWRQQL